MSKHSKNANSQPVFTYGQKQKLKGQYGTIETRISQDSIKKFELCNVCTSRIIEPMCCDKGHVFCRACIIQFMVKQKKKIQQQNEKAEQHEKKKQEKQELKQLQERAKKIVEFQKYDNFQAISDRYRIEESKPKQENIYIKKDQAKPIGIYEHNNQKDRFVKSSFWTIQNTPQYEPNPEKLKNIVKCPASDHKLTMKKLRSIIIKEIDGQFICGICNKEIGRQKIGSYKCGHIVCVGCKSDKCEMCDKKQGWIEVQSNRSAFASHNKADIKTYTHAFYL